MDLSAIYSKTPKGLRTRSSLIGGLSSHLMKVLTHVDGSSSAETILLKFDKLTPQQLIADLTRLEQEGYIRLATATSTADDSWSITVNFEPMVVEEYRSEEELEVSAQEKTAEQTRQIELEQAKQEEVRRLAAQLKADKLRDNERIKAETKVIAQLEQERLALEAARREAEAQLKARQEAERIEQQQAVERATKLAEETRLQAELKAREAAEQAEAEAKAKAKQESERLEALNMAKAAEEARQAELKAQAEYQAQLEQAAKVAAEQARVEAEAAAQAAETKRLKQAEKAAQAAALKEKLEQEKARLEIAIVLRKAEEDRKNAEAQAKAEKLEAKRRLKAEQDARAQAERKAKEEAKEFARQQKLKAQAEEKAKAEASEQAQLEAARVAKETEIARKIALENERLQAKQVADALAAQAEVEQTQRLERENQVQLAAEAVRAHLLAEESANLAAKQNAQLEMERIGREADQAHQKAAKQQQSAEQQNTQVRQLASAQQQFPEIEKSEPDTEDFDAAEEAVFEAEERAAEAKTHRMLEKTTKQAAVDEGRSDIKNTAKTAAAAMASVHDKARSFVSTKKIKQWLGSFTKVTFIYVPVLLVLVLLVLSFINLSFLIKPIEQMASESIGETVGIKKVHASLWPQPNLVLEDVAVGTGNNIEAVHVLPVIASLFEDVKVVKSLVIEGLSIEQANFSQSLQWASNASKAKTFKVEQINLKNLTLVIRDLQLEPFDGKVTLTDVGALSSIELVSSNNALSVKISPQGNDSEIVLKATNWVLPFNQKIVFSALNAKGLANQYKLNFSQIDGEIFGGNLTGQANIEWPDGTGLWLSAGEFKLSNANTEALLNNFGSAVIIDGQLTLDARFSGEASEVSRLASNTITDANFDVRQGSIQRIELVRGVLSPGGQSLAGDNTNFDKLTGSIKLNQNQYQFGKLVLASSQFNAYGFINIDTNQILTGKVHADLAAQSRHLKANFGITGRGEDLKSN